MVALTPMVFFSKASWHNIVDFFVVILAFAASIAAAVIIANIDDEQKEVNSHTYLNINSFNPQLHDDGYYCEKSEEATGKRFSFIVALRFIRIFRYGE